MRISKSPEQVAQEATTAAADELKQVMEVIKVAGYAQRIDWSGGSTALIETAARLYEKHVGMIEADALEFVDASESGAHPFNPFGQFLNPFAGGPSVGGPSRLGRERPDYLRIAREAEARRRHGVNADVYPEPEPGTVGGALCLACGKPIRTAHVQQTMQETEDITSPEECQCSRTPTS